MGCYEIEKVSLDKPYLIAEQVHNYFVFNYYKQNNYVLEMSLMFLFIIPIATLFFVNHATDNGFTLTSNYQFCFSHKNRNFLHMVCSSHQFSKHVCDANYDCFYGQMLQVFVDHLQ